MHVMNYMVKAPRRSVKRTGVVSSDVVCWLESEFGERYIAWDYWFMNHSFFFKTEEDKVKFILKWI